MGILKSEADFVVYFLPQPQIIYHARIPGRFWLFLYRWAAAHGLRPANPARHNNDKAIVIPLTDFEQYVEKIEMSTFPHWNAPIEARS